MASGVWNKPKLIVFDLDYTLWPFWVDTHVDPPFRKEENGKIYDRNEFLVEPYSDVPRMLHKLHADGYTLGVASRTSATDAARVLLKMLDWDKYFTYKEIYPGQKTNHFKRMRDKSGLQYNEMLFFDDEERNIKDVGAIGVVCIYCQKGVSEPLINKALQVFSQKTSKR